MIDCWKNHSSRQLGFFVTEATKILRQMIAGAISYVLVVLMLQVLRGNVLFRTGHRHIRIHNCGQLNLTVLHDYSSTVAVYQSTMTERRR